jgi:mRNA-degrading endonuclease RelE of RelBE toxin-antitoxin system
MYEIFLTNQARRIFKKQSPDLQTKLKSEASSLSNNPLAGEPLQGGYRQYRSLHFVFKGVAYQIIYQIFTKTNTIVVFLADKRENIYKRLEEMKL